MRLPNLRLPLRLLRGHTGRLVLTLVALAWGVALVCAIDVVNRAVLSAFVEVIDTMAGRAALEIAAGEGALFPEDVATRAAAVAGGGEAPSLRGGAGGAHPPRRRRLALPWFGDSPYAGSSPVL